MADSPVGLEGFRDELLEFLATTRTQIDHQVADVVIEARGASWRVDGVVRGTYRRAEFAGPDPNRYLALGALLTLGIEREGRRAEGTIASGAGHLRIEVDRPDVVLDALLPLDEATAEVVRALGDAGIPIEVHGPTGLVATLPVDRGDGWSTTPSGNSPG